MPRSAASPILHMIRRVAEDRQLKELPDQDLLRSFLTGRDEAAFGVLLRRHGSMVLHVCRNVLGNEQDAEDAFQATFLIFAQKGGAIRKRSSIGSWLHGVAYRTAIKARARSAARQVHEAQIRASMPVADDVTWREVQQLVHAELNRLPERYRTPLVYCYLEGKTQDEAALLIGVCKATVKKRLERGRSLLRARLVRQGLGPAAILTAAAWPAATAQAAVSLVLADSTIKAASFVGAGQAATADIVSPSVISLTEGVLKAMFLTKIKLVSAVALAVIVSAGVAGLSFQASAQQSQPIIRPQDPNGQAERPLPRVNRSVADELDALHLEIEALRKEIRATRERVKALETERGQKQKAAPLSAIQRGVRGTANPLNDVEGPIADVSVGQQLGTANEPPSLLGRRVSAPERPYDVFAAAEEALAKLRQNPRDKRAAEALEKATRRLKARTEVNDPARTGPGAASPAGQAPSVR
jgi:RNA polymerase sigma factor (sigma-70 family)